MIVKLYCSAATKHVVAKDDHGQIVTCSCFHKLPIPPKSGSPYHLESDIVTRGGQKQHIPRPPIQKLKWN